MEYTHKPVLLDACIQALNIRPDGIYVDGTLGRAGHSREIAGRLTTGRLICIDRDQAAIDAAQDRLAPWLDRVTLIHSNFSELKEVLSRCGVSGADGMLFDLGVSSPQLDDASRGFSYMQDAPLDMRMDTSAPLSAADIVNTWSQEELRRILFEYGEERYAPAIARAIVRARETAPVKTTLELVEIIKSAMPPAAPHAAGGGGRAEPRRSPGRHHLPLSGGPDRQADAGGAGPGMRLPAGVSGVRVRQKAPGAAGDPQARHGGRRGAGGESKGPQRQAAGGGKVRL